MRTSPSKRCPIDNPIDNPIERSAAMINAPHKPETAESLQDGIGWLMEAWSLEATAPKKEEIEGLQNYLSPGARVYLSALPNRPYGALIESAQMVDRAGFEPVPHLAVRNYRSHDEMADFLGRAHDESNVRRVLVIAGDRDTPAGPFADSLQLIESGLLQDAGIWEIDIAGHPDGHPKIAHEDLAQVLRTKISAARAAKLDVRVVTQFSFDAKTLMSWLLPLTREYPDLPIAVGLAGPANTRTLFKFAVRCGVRASARGLGRGIRLIGDLTQDATPYRIVKTLAEGWIVKNRATVSLHFYSFGGIEKTAAWAQNLASGNLPT